MKVKYKIKASFFCPNDGQKDDYNITISSKDPIMVEQIKEAISALQKRGPIYQESLTEQLSKMLSAKVKISGVHQNILIISRSQCGAQ